MGAMNNENGAQSIQVPLGNITADGSILAGYIPAKSKLKSVKLVNGAAIAQSDTDYVDIQLKIGSLKLAGFSTKLTGGNGALQNGVPVDMALVVKDIPALSKLEVVYDETGTIAMTDAHAVVEFYPL
jgi:hypothetical protein